MKCVVLVLALFVATVCLAQAPAPQPLQPEQPPQTARQALLEMFFGQTPNHLEKHLPEITKKAMKRLDAPGSPSPFLALNALGMEARAGGAKFETMDTGSTLLVSEQQGNKEKIEIVVERDELIGEEDQIELSFHMSRNGKPEPLPFLPRLTVAMKTESDIWRLYELSFAARMPLGDPDFLKDLVGQMEEKQQRQNEWMTIYSLRSIMSAETAYHVAHPEKAYTCALSELAAAAKDGGERNKSAIDPALASGTSNGYIFAMTSCDNFHYKVAAEPATPSAGRRAFCADESGDIKFSRNGKAATCLRSGQTFNPDAPESTD